VGHLGEKDPHRERYQPLLHHEEAALYSGGLFTVAISRAFAGHLTVYLSRCIEQIEKNLLYLAVLHEHYATSSQVKKISIPNPWPLVHLHF